MFISKKMRLKIIPAEEMSLYDIVSKKNYKILYTYACIHLSNNENNSVYRLGWGKICKWRLGY